MYKYEASVYDGESKLLDLETTEESVSALVERAVRGICTPSLIASLTYETASEAETGLTQAVRDAHRPSQAEANVAVLPLFKRAMLLVQNRIVGQAEYQTTVVDLFVCFEKVKQRVPGKLGYDYTVAYVRPVSDDLEFLYVVPRISEEKVAWMDWSTA